MYNLCTLTKFNRKSILKEIHSLIELGYGSYNDLISLTLQEISDIKKVIISLRQQETLQKAGM